MSSPNYLSPTLSHKLYEFTNREQDLVRQAFNSSNFTEISKLPVKISPSNVSKSIRLTTLDRVSKRAISLPRKTQNFEWLPDSYNLSHDYFVEEKKKTVEKQLRISQEIFHNPGVCKKLKNEEINGNKLIYVEDNFNSLDAHAKRIKWIKNSFFVNKEFKSPQKNNFKFGKNRIGEILKILTSIIEKNWEKAKFRVFYTEEGIFEMKFDMESTESLKSLHLFMNNLQENSAEIEEFLLRKRIEKWGVTEGSWISYQLVPPWVHLRRSDAFSGLYPHSLSISSSRTGKNVPGSQRSTLFGLVSN